MRCEESRAVSRRLKIISLSRRTPPRHTALALATTSLPPTLETAILVSETNAEESGYAPHLCAGLPVQPSFLFWQEQQGHFLPVLLKSFWLAGLLVFNRVAFFLTQAANQVITTHSQKTPKVSSNAIDAEILASAVACASGSRVPLNECFAAN